MNIAVKIASYIVLCLLFIGVAIYCYTFRQQEIDVHFVPNEFTYCGKQIWGKDKEYQEIISWLNNNRNGWVLSFVSYVPKQIYRHPAFVVNVLDGGVVVSYKTDYGYPQYVKTIDHGLNLHCDKNS